MFTLDRDPTLAMIPTPYLFRPPIPIPACRWTRCQRPPRSIDGATPFSSSQPIVTIS
jgi:hypothetical protein